MFKKKYLWIAVLLFVCVQVWTLYLTFSFPVAGINIDQNSDGTWVVNKFDSESIAEQSDIMIGDRILQVNDKDAGEYFSIIKWRSIDQYHSLTINRGGTAIRILSSQTAGATDTYLISLFGEVISFMVAFSLYRSLSGSMSAKYLSYVFGNMGIIFMSLGASIRGDASGKAIIFIAMMLLPILHLKFLMILFEEKASIHLSQKLVNWLYRIFAGASLFMSVLFTDFSATYLLYRIAVSLVMLYFLIGLMINLAFLSYMYVKYRKHNNYVSVLTKTIWVSLFISFSPICLFSFLPNLLFGHEWLNSFYMGWFIFVLPITFAYLIAAKKLYDIDILVRRILLIVTVSIVPSAALAGVIRLLFPGEADSKHLVIIFTLLLSCIAFVLYSFEYFTNKLQPILFPRKHQLQVALKKISTKLRTISSLNDLKDIILVDIVNTLQVYGGAIVFKYDETMETISEGEIDIGKVESLVDSCNFYDADYSIIEVNRHEEYTSYLIISRKMTGTMPSTEELQWLNLITSYLAVSLENVYLIRKLTMKLEQLAMQIQSEDVAQQLVWFRKMMFDMQERERTRIATDLHDTTMQDLFFLKQRLLAVLEKYAYSAEDCKQMESLLDYIDIINVNLRQSCFELHPYMLKEIGLVKTIERLVEFEAPISPFELSFRSNGAEIIERKDLETKRHLFRMVQELINNAKKHSNASYIHITLTVSQGSLYFEYEDNGVGFDVKRVGGSEIGSSGMGMDQIKSRIYSLNGKFELQSGKGKGVKWTVTIPIKEGLTA